MEKKKKMNIYSIEDQMNKYVLKYNRCVPSPISSISFNLIQG